MESTQAETGIRRTLLPGRRSVYLTNTEIGQRVAGNGREFYAWNILRQDELPENPGDLPKEIHLYPNLLGNLEQAIFETGGMHVPGHGAETAETIRYQPKTISVSYSGVWTGNSQSTEGEGLITTAESLLNLSRPIIHYHTHPKSHPLPSHVDVEGYAHLQSASGFLNLIGSDIGIMALAVTRRSQEYLRPNRLISAMRSLRILKGYNTYVDRILPIVGQLEVAMTRDFNFMDFGLKDQALRLYQFAREVENVGFGMYWWAPPTEYVQSGDIAKGITLTKIELGAFERAGLVAKH